MVLSEPDLYSVLGAQRDATLEHLKKCYKKEAMKWHPDRCQSRVKLGMERWRECLLTFTHLLPALNLLPAFTGIA